MRRALILGVWAPWSLFILLATPIKDCPPKPQPTPTPTVDPGPTPTPAPTPTPTPEPTPSPVPTPSPSKVCTGPLNASWAGPGPVTTAIGPFVNRVMSDLTGCSEGSDCPHGEGPGEAGAQKWMARVNAELRKRGMCAIQHEPGVTDEIAVNTVCTGPFEGYHVANFGGGKVVWSPNAARPSWIPTGGACGTSEPSPTPPPTPLPTPGPTPTPAPGACPIPAPGDNWLADLKPHGGQQLDLTPYVGNPTHTPNQPWPGCGVNRCPLSCEKGPVACACQVALFGEPVWSTSNGACDVFTTSSAFTVKVASGECLLSTKGSVPGSARIGSWQVLAASPACHVGQNGLCQ